MKGVKLSARDRRALLLGGAGLAIVLAWSLVVSPYLQAVADARARLEAVREVVGREHQLLADARHFGRTWEAGAARLLETAPALFGGDSDGAAGAALAGYIQQAARQERVYVAQVEPLPTASAGGGLVALGVRVRGESDLEGLLRFLDLLEAGPKLIRIPQLQVDRATARTAANQTGVLTFSLTATGYTLPEQATARIAGRATETSP
jgi:hypothetical protein